MTDRSAQYLDGSPTYEHRSASGNTYHLSRNSTAAKSAGVEWSCDCMAWIIQKKRPCKHLKADPRISQTKKVIPFDTKSFYTTDTDSFSKGEAIDSKEQASQKKIATRVKRESEKAQKLETLRYGFQLAFPYTHADFVPGKMVAEVKYDGILAMLIDGRIINRSGNDITNRFPEIQSTSEVVLVGEIVILRPDGTSDFHALQERSTDDPIKIRLRSQLTPATFIAFDFLGTSKKTGTFSTDGTDLTDAPFSVRREALEFFLTHHVLKRVQLIEQIPLKVRTDVTKLVETCREMEAEGVMVKRLDASYVAKRGKNWMKAKTWQEEEFDIIRYGDTGVGKGFTVFIQSGNHEQEVVMNSVAMQNKVKAGHRRVEIKFLSKSVDGAMRFPSVRRLINDE